MADVIVQFGVLDPLQRVSSCHSPQSGLGTVVWGKLGVWEAGPCVCLVVTLFRVSLGHAVPCK